MAHHMFSRGSRRRETRKARNTRRKSASRRRRGDFGSGVRLDLEQLEQRLALTAGALDTTFDVDGVLVEDLGLTRDDEIYASAVQLDGKIVVAGLINTSTGRDSLVARYNADGSRDTSFGTGGYTLVPASLTGVDDRINGVAIDALGRILAVGEASDALGQHGVSVCRFTADGQLDTTFDGDGIAYTFVENASGTESSSSASAVALQSDGKIVVGGMVDGSIYYTAQDFAVLRYNDDGSLDTSFGTGGYVVTDFAGADDIINDLVIQSDGKIVAVGTADMEGTTYDDFAIARYNTDGSLDTTFDGDGLVTANIVPTASSSQDYATAVALEDDGQIVVGGYSAATARDFVVARYNTDGSLDTSFGASSALPGTVRFNMTSTSDNLMDLAIQSDGKYVVAGFDGLTTTSSVLMARLLTDGSLDTTFDGDGKVTTKFADYGYPTTLTRANSLNIQPDGQLLVAGWIKPTGGTRDVAIVRYDSGLPQPSAGGPYVIDEPSGSVTLDASGSSGTGTLTYEWDLDNNGTYETAGVTAVFSVTDVDGPATFTVPLRVTDDEGVAYTAATVVVVNLNPTADAGDFYNVAEGGSTTLHGTGTDPAGAADPLTFEWDLDGDSVYETVGADPVFDASGLIGPMVVTVSLRVSDGDGGVAYDTATVNVLDVGLEPGDLDPDFDLDGVLVEDLGLGYNDEILASAVQADGKIVVAGLINITGLGRDSLVMRYNADGTRDTTFGTSGYTIVPASLNGVDDRIYDIAIDAQGRIVAVGQASDAAGDVGFSVMRFTADGQLDTTFADGGSVITLLDGTEGGQTPAYATAVSLAADGKIVVGGILQNSYVYGGWDYAVARYNEDGSLDATFGASGYVATDFAGEDDGLADVAIQGDGRIVAVGYADPGGTASDAFGIIRYNADGSLDTTFDGDGMVMTTAVPSAYTSQDRATAVALEDDGQIVVAGRSGVAVTQYTPATYDFIVARYNTDGSLDGSFGASSEVPGTVRIDAGSTSDQVTDIVVQTDGKYIVGGHDNIPDGNGFELVRLLTDGSLDTTFNGDGIVTTDFDALGYSVAQSRITGLSFQPDGMLVAAGWVTSDSSGAYDIAIARYATGMLSASVGGPYIISEPGGSVTLDASASAGDGTLSYAWDLDGDDVYETVGPTATYTATDVDGPAIIEVGLRVSNGTDPDAYATAQIAIVNVAPTADAGGPYAVAENGTVTLTGSGSDVAGTNDPLTFEWDLDGDSVYETVGASPVFDGSTVDGPATVTVTLRVSDGDGGVAYDTATITVANSDPVVDAGGTYTVDEGGTVTLVGTATDVAADVLTYEWDLDGDTVFETAGASPVFDASALDGPTSLVVALRVTDDDGGVGYDTATINVVNVDPTADAGGTYTVDEGGTVTLTGTGSDIAADVLTYEWDLDGDTVFETAGATVTFDASLLDGPTSVAVGFRVTDDDGGVAYDTATINVVNVNPTADAGGTYTVDEGGSVTLAGVGTDVAADVLTYEWDLDGDTVFETSGASPVFDASTLDGPTSLMVALRVTDDDGGVAYDVATINVVNVDPTADVGGTYTVDEGGTVTLTGTGSDIAADVLTYEWDLDGDTVFETAGATVTFDASLLDGPTSVAVGFRVTDDDDGVAYDAATINVVNVDPTANAGGTYSVDEGGSVTLTGTGSDVAADVLTYAWDLDGDSVYETAGVSATFDASLLDGPTSVSVGFRVTDDDGGVAYDTATINVVNVDPTADAGGAYTVDEGGSVTLTGTGSDIAADVLTYEWDLDGDTVFETSGASPVFDASGQDGPSTLTVALRITDDDGGVAYDTATINVVNVDPTANAGGTYSVDEGGSVTLTGAGSDVAADVLTYAWDLDGDSVYETAGASATFDASLLDGPTSVSVGFRVTDDDGGVAYDTATINVVNVAPTADAGGDYVTFDDTAITLTGTGSDVAGDALTYAWDLDGDSVFETSGASVTFDPVALGLSGVVATVTLQVTDDDGGVTYDTADVTVLATGTLLIDGVLQVVGSGSSDTTFIYASGGQIVVYGTFNDDNPVAFDVADVDSINIRGRDGDDVIVISQSISISTTIDGGEGNDVIVGGAGRDVIYGGSGNDLLAGQRGDDVLFGGTGQDDLFGGSGDDVLVAGSQDDILYGGSGDDLLIGGLDNDAIYGGSGDDILIGGTTIHDNDVAALDEVMAVWTSSATFSDRVDELTDSGGLLEAGVAVFDDDDLDILVGGAGRDLLFADLYLWDGSIDLVLFNHRYDYLEPVS